MNKINIAEILKDCPSGMELDCTLLEDLEFDGIVDNKYVPIRCRVKNPNGGYYVYNFTKYGCWFNTTFAKCAIFPKGKTTWEGFQRPFKDGDVLVHTQNERFIMSIYKSNEIGIIINTHVIFRDREEGLSVGMQICCYTDSTRFATEEEKEKLFDAIKSNGYKWNPETKTLEKLPKFKVGDRIHNKYYKDYIYDIHDITDKGYRAKEIDADSPILILFGSQEDNYELVPNKFDITTLKPYDKVLYRMHDKDTWRNGFYSFYKSNHHFVTSLTIVKQCIPYEENKHLLGTADDCDEYFKTWE